ncbi:MAG: sigma-70 family RNA polymerase sigma factor [bacterium]|nr:sigma-70 family RNA polymerase sigma factor [bacterium]
MGAYVKKRDRFAEYFSEYYQVVYNAVFPKVGSAEDTEDLCQEVFLILYRNLEDTDNIDNVRKWLYGTLKNVVLQYYRRKEKPKANIDDIFDDVSLTFVNGFRDTRILIEEAIEEEIEDDDERTLVELIAFHNYSYTKVAEYMGLTKRIVGYRYNQVVKKILENLERKGINNIEDLL